MSSLSDEIRDFAENAQPIFETHNWQWRNEGVPSRAAIENAVWGCIGSVDDQFAANVTQTCTYSSRGRVVVTGMWFDRSRNAEYRISLDVRNPL